MGRSARDLNRLFVRGTCSSAARAKNQHGCTAVEMGHCSKSSTRPRQERLTPFRSVATIMKTGVQREDQPRARRNDFVVSSFRRARGCSSRGTPVFMIVATERKDVSPACLGRVLDFEQWPISTAVQHPTFWLELPHSMYPERIGAAERPNKKLASRGGGVTTLRNHFSSYQSALVQCTNIPG